MKKVINKILSEIQARRDYYYKCLGPMEPVVPIYESPDDEESSIVGHVVNEDYIDFKARASEANVIMRDIVAKNIPEDMDVISDDYHTFGELYYYRMLYNALWLNDMDECLLKDYNVHKSKRHHTGEECFDGKYFIVMVNLPTGQISNHYELKYWDLFNIPEKEIADEWDGHSPQEAAIRMHKYLELQ